MGRPWPQPGEPMWTHEDRMKALAWQLRQAEMCPGCGTREADWRDPSTLEELEEPRWMPEVHRCLGCAARAAIIEEARDDHADLDGAVVIFRRWDPAKDAPALGDG